MSAKTNTSIVSEILRAGLIVGTLDILAAFIYYYITSGNEDVFTVLRYIASAVFGKQAFSGGIKTSVAGLVFHYFIAFSFTAFYYWLFQKLTFLKTNPLVSGLAYGVFIWAVMNLVVVPLTKIGARTFNPVNASVNALILILCIGVPLAFMAKRFYRNRTAT